MVDQGNFDNFYRNNYDPSLASNQYTVNTIAGTPDTYEIRDGGGALLQSGDYVAGNKILQRAGADPVAASGARRKTSCWIHPKTTTSSMACPISSRRCGIPTSRRIPSS